MNARHTGWGWDRLIGQRQYPWSSCYHVAKAAGLNNPMNPVKAQSKRITLLLAQWRDGNDEAMHELMPLVYQALYARARYYIQKERPHHTLSSTALVNEVYLELFDERERQWKNRSHFFAVAAKAMKNILIRYAQARNAQKRGGDRLVFTMPDMDGVKVQTIESLAPLDDALKLLEDKDPKKAWIVEMRYFAGMSISEVAEVLGISTSTVKRELKFSRAWLRRFLKQD